MRRETKGKGRKKELHLYPLAYPLFCIQLKIFCKFPSLLCQKFFFFAGVDSIYFKFRQDVYVVYKYQQWKMGRITEGEKAFRAWASEMWFKVAEVLVGKINLIKFALMKKMECVAPHADLAIVLIINNIVEKY